MRPEWNADLSPGSLLIRFGTSERDSQAVGSEMKIVHIQPHNLRPAKGTGVGSPPDPEKGSDHRRARCGRQVRGQVGQPEHCNVSDILAVTLGGSLPPKWMTVNLHGIDMLRVKVSPSRVKVSLSPNFGKSKAS